MIVGSRMLLLAVALLAQTTSGLVSRRCILTRGAAAAAVGQLLPAFPALAAQRGAEPAYQNQAFDDNLVCVRRTPLGACAETAPGGRDQAAASSGGKALKVLQAEPEAESELVRLLLQKTADNEQKNAQLVKEKTIKAAQAGTFGPFAKDAPIMREDGSFDIVPLAKYDRLKDRGKITKTATGLDAYVKGFDPDAPEPKSKFLGIF